MRKKNIKLLKKVKLKNPIVIAAWPGMGDVAFTAAKFLRDKLKAVEFASFEPAEYFQPTGVVIKGQVIDLAEMPQGIFYICRDTNLNNELVIFISQAQPLLEKSYEYAREFINFVKELNCKTLITFAAMPSAIEHTQAPRVWSAVTDKELIKSIEKIAVEIIPSGQISGMNGLILGIAKESGINGICLLGEIPFYTIQAENPLASVSILKALGSLFHIELNFKELQQQALLLNQEIDKAISFLKPSDILERHQEPIDMDEIERIKNVLAAYTKTPDSVKKVIENLFVEARKDTAKTRELKQVLDKWSIYKEYEDRFLDLFRRKKDN